MDANVYFAFATKTLTDEEGRLGKGVTISVMASGPFGEGWNLWANGWTGLRGEGVSDRIKVDVIRGNLLPRDW